MANNIGSEKATVAHQEVLEPTVTNDFDEESLHKREVQGIDYSGAHEKTDPKEIKLVRKLDTWIMPMYVIGQDWTDSRTHTDCLEGYGSCTG